MDLCHYQGEVNLRASWHDQMSLSLMKLSVVHELRGMFETARLVEGVARDDWVKRSWF
jgi:hypothetical protein